MDLLQHIAHFAIAKCIVQEVSTGAALRVASFRHQHIVSFFFFFFKLIKSFSNLANLWCCPAAFGTGNAGGEQDI